MFSSRFKRSKGTFMYCKFISNFKTMITHVISLVCITNTLGNTKTFFLERENSSCCVKILKRFPFYNILTIL